MSQQSSIYVIDDDLDVRSTLTYIFRVSGFKVTAFSDPFEALSHPLATQDTCIVLDLSMPMMDGLVFQRELRKRNIVIPIVIYSGTANVDTAVSAMTEGAFTVLRKPAKKAKLISTVTTAIADFTAKHSEKILNKKAMEQLSSLSKREYEIAILISEGLTSSVIAEKLFISTRTVEAHRASIFLKLNVKAPGPLAQLVLRTDMYNSSVSVSKDNSK